MPSRRRFVSLCGLATLSVTSGCATGDGPKPVDVLLQNDDTEAWQMTVTVNQDTSEEVFQTAETVPPDTGEDLGEVLIEDAFEGTGSDQFTVQVRFDGEPVGTFDYEITCESDNRFSLLVEHRPYSPDDGDPVDYVARRCGE